MSTAKAGDGKASETKLEALDLKMTHASRDAWLAALSPAYIRKLADFGVQHAMGESGPAVLVDAREKWEGPFETVSPGDARMGGIYGKLAASVRQLKRAGRFPVILRCAADKLAQGAPKGQSFFTTFMLYFPQEGSSCRADASPEDIRKHTAARHLESDALAMSALALDPKLKGLVDAYITSGLSDKSGDALRKELAKYTILKQAPLKP